MDSLHKKRNSQGLAILAMAVLLLGMVSFNILRPSPEAKVVETDVTSTIPADEPTTLTGEDRLELQEQWERFRPESRKKILFELARSQLQQFRSSIAELSAEERSEAIRRAVEDLRKQRAGLGAEERERIRQSLTAGEAHELTRHFMDFYHQELTAKERSELDPLVHEWLKQLEERLIHEP